MEPPLLTSERYCSYSLGGQGLVTLELMNFLSLGDFIGFFSVRSIPYPPGGNISLGGNGLTTDGSKCHQERE